MGNIIKDTPVGIDVWIQKLQIAIYNEFVSDFGEWNSYGRLYRNFDNEGKEYLPYPFQEIVEYESPPFFEDTVNLQSFFDISEVQKIDSANQSSCRVLFYLFADLHKIFPNEYDRFDEGLMNKVLSFVQQQFGFILHSKRVGIKTVMKDWSGYTQENIKQFNESNLFAFALEFEISEYYICYSDQYQQPVTNLIPYTRYNPVGIDYFIQKFQIDLYNFILIKFSGISYNCFGRCYRNKVSKQDYIPQAYVKLNTTHNFEYINILFEDTVAVQSFFDIGETMRCESDSLLTYSNISLYFFVDLSKLYSDQNFRYDEEFIILISQFLIENSGFELYSISRGIKSVMNEYSGFKIKMNQKANMQPNLCFRLDSRKYYDESVEYCNLIPQGTLDTGQFNPMEFDPTQFK